MTNQEFRCWISGYLTLSEEPCLDARQIRIIENHAALVKATMGNLDADIKKLLRVIREPVEGNPASRSRKIIISVLASDIDIET